jgi:hypothetical protein
MAVTRGADPQDILRDRDNEIATSAPKSSGQKRRRMSASPQSTNGHSENMLRHVRQSESASSNV